MTDSEHLAERPSRPATIYDVARAAGVSAQTVSRLLQGFQGIRPETRHRVERALAQLDYRPNLTARTLKSGRSHRIGALTHAIDQIGPNQVVRGAAAAAREIGYVLDIVTFDMADPTAIADGLSIVLKPDLAGVLVLASTDEMIDAFENTDFRVPVRLFVGDGAAQEAESAEITTIVDHLVALGHRNFFHIAGPANSPAARRRRSTFETKVAASGGRSTGVFVGDWSSAAGYEAMRDLPAQTTAVIAANDQMGLGALLAVQQRGIRVPDDLSITGIDDIPESGFLYPPLTTVHVDFIAQGAAAITDLMTAIAPGEIPPAPEHPSWLVARQSSGPVRA